MLANIVRVGIKFTAFSRNLGRAGAGLLGFGNFTRRNNVRPRREYCVRVYTPAGACNIIGPSAALSKLHEFMYHSRVISRRYRGWGRFFSFFLFFSFFSTPFIWSWAARKNFVPETWRIVARVMYYTV